MKLLVLGASGGCGRWLVRLAVARGHQVRALVRPATAFDAPDGTEVIRGEVLDESTLDRALDGCDAVLSGLGIKRKATWNPWSGLASPPHLATQVARQLVELMPRHGVRRVVVISAGGVGESLQHTNSVIRWMIGHSTIKVSYQDLEAMEAVFAASGLDWMAVRPTTLTGGPPSGKAQVVAYYGLATRIARAEVAAYMLDALERPEPFAERTPMIGS